MLTVRGNELFGGAKELDASYAKPRFFFCLSASGFRRGFQKIDLAAHDVPVTRFRRLQPAAQEHLAVGAQDHEPGAYTGKVDTGP